jgi:branched-subunit amino acid transport protein
MDNYLLVILIAFLVTYPVRALPAVYFSKLKLNAFFQRFLDLIPYTAITALVFPGIFMCIDNNAYVAYAGTGIAILCSLFKAPLSVTVVATVIAVYLLLIF